MICLVFLFYLLRAALLMTTLMTNDKCQCAIIIKYDFCSFSPSLHSSALSAAKTFSSPLHVNQSATHMWICFTLNFNSHLYPLHSSFVSCCHILNSYSFGEYLITFHLSPWGECSFNVHAHGSRFIWYDLHKVTRLNASICTLLSTRRRSELTSRQLQLGSQWEMIRWNEIYWLVDFHWSLLHPHPSAGIISHTPCVLRVLSVSLHQSLAFSSTLWVTCSQSMLSGVCDI